VTGSLSHARYPPPPGDSSFVITHIPTLLVLQAWQHCDATLLHVIVSVLPALRRAKSQITISKVIGNCGRRSNLLLTLHSGCGVLILRRCPDSIPAGFSCTLCIIFWGCIFWGCMTSLCSSHPTQIIIPRGGGIYLIDQSLYLLSTIGRSRSTAACRGATMVDETMKIELLHEFRSP